MNTPPDFDENLPPDGPVENDPEMSSEAEVSRFTLEDFAPPYELTNDKSSEESAGFTPRERSSFEDLTLADVAARLWHSPRQTLSALIKVSQTPVDLSAEVTLPDYTPKPAAVKETSALPVSYRAAFLLSLYLSAFFLAWWGSGVLFYAPIRTESEALDKGAPLLLLSFFLWLFAEAYANWDALRVWWQRLSTPKPVSGTDVSAAAHVPTHLPVSEVYWEGIHPLRVFSMLGGLFFSFMAWQFTKDNLFTTIGFFSWLISAFLWSAAFTPKGWTLYRLVAPLIDFTRQFTLRGNWTLYFLCVIMLLGAIFRFSDLTGVPPEMTSDHVEKLLDAQRVLDGTTQVFFPNNGGREPFQMYAMAFLSRFPGMGMNFDTLKLLSVLEGLLTLPILWWMGREIVGERDRQLGNIVGLILAALVAVSYWHTALSRLALRIVLTPLVTGLLMVFFTRALRHNRRSDFILSGLVLGFGLYTYQAVRMLPVVIVVGLLMVLVFKARDMRERWQYVVNLSVLVLVSLVVFVPMLGFSAQFPEHFWMRSSGRLFGDAVIQTQDESGNLIYRSGTLQERLEAFNQNLPILSSNIRNALLMYNWKGDVAWINAAPNYPAMDTLTGALLIVGLAAWLARMIARRDVVDWLIPIMLFIMLLPSALSIAYPIENPSATRTSGTLPEAYLLAAFPLGVIAVSITHIMPRVKGAILAAGLVAVVVVGAYRMNSTIYFEDYRKAYLGPALPYTQAGSILRGFAESDGAFGNAFMIAYPYWWDHRAVGLNAGLTDWPNGIITIDHVPRFLFDSWQRVDKYRLNPDKDLLFFYSIDDEESDRLVKKWFPEGRAQRVGNYQNEPLQDFMIYRVPYLGVDGLARFFEEHL